MWACASNDAKYIECNDNSAPQATRKTSKILNFCWSVEAAQRYEYSNWLYINLFRCCNNSATFFLLKLLSLVQYQNQEDTKPCSSTYQGFRLMIYDWNFKILISSDDRVWIESRCRLTSTLVEVLPFPTHKLYGRWLP